MLRAILLLGALFLGGAQVVSAQGGSIAPNGVELPPGTVMHRLQVPPDKTGTVRAASTGGGFSVQMPLAFNDFALLNSQGDVARVCSLGGKSASGLSVQASRMVYIDSAKLTDLLSRAKAAPPGSRLVSATDLTFNGRPAVDLVIKGRRWVTWMRWIVLDHDAIVLAVEAPIVLEEYAQSLVQPLYNSLTVDGECIGNVAH